MICKLCQQPTRRKSGVCAACLCDAIDATYYADRMRPGNDAMRDRVSGRQAIHDHYEGKPMGPRQDPLPFGGEA